MDNAIQKHTVNMMKQIMNISTEGQHNPVIINPAIFIVVNPPHVREQPKSDPPSIRQQHSKAEINVNNTKTIPIPKATQVQHIIKVTNASIASAIPAPIMIAPTTPIIIGPPINIIAKRE